MVSSRETSFSLPNANAPWVSRRPVAAFFCSLLCFSIPPLLSFRGSNPAVRGLLPGVKVGGGGAAMRLIGASRCSSNLDPVEMAILVDFRFQLPLDRLITVIACCWCRMRTESERPCSRSARRDRSHSCDPIAASSMDKSGAEHA